MFDIVDLGRVFDLTDLFSDEDGILPWPFPFPPLPTPDGCGSSNILSHYY